MPMNGAELKISERKITITPNFRLVDEHVGQAVHRLNAVLVVLNLGEIHLVR